MGETEDRLTWIRGFLACSECPAGAHEQAHRRLTGAMDAGDLDDPYFMPWMVGGAKPSRSEYQSWHAARSRCHNENSQNYDRYGARGIVMCDGWRRHYALFIGDMGPKPAGRWTLDRINNDGNYEPGNCRWATQKQQMNNIKRNVFATVGGVTRPIAEWCEEFGIPYNTAMNRKHLGWDMARAVTEPVNTKKANGLSRRKRAA